MCNISVYKIVVLSGINNLKSVRFFKLVLRYDYSIVLNVYIFWHAQYVLLKALPPVCMKYTAQDEANIARGEAECYICHKTLIKSCMLSYKQSGSVLSVSLYFTFTKVSTKYSSLVILTHSLNK